MQNKKLPIFAPLCVFAAFYCTTTVFAQTPNTLASSAAVTPTPLKAGIFLNSNSFDIPFSVEKTGAQPVEVQLFVSRDRGQSWKFAARQPASENGFPFEATEDGDFWFSTRTIDARGVSYPTGPMSPQLQVFVDTTNPKIETSADTDAAGNIVLSYTIIDAATDQDFRLEYMTDAVRQWMPITIQGEPGRRQQDGALVGRIAWTPQTEWRHVYVRMIVRDKAGNQSVVNDQVERPRIAANPMQLASNPQQPSGANINTASNRPTFGGAPQHQQPAPQQQFQQLSTFAPQQMPAQGPPMMQGPPSITQPGIAAGQAIMYQQPTNQGPSYRGAGPVPTYPTAGPSGFGLNAPLQNQMPNIQPAPLPAQPTYHQAVPAGLPYQNLIMQNGSTSTQTAPQMPLPPANNSQAFRPLQPNLGAIQQEQSEPPAKTDSRVLSLRDAPRVTRSKQFSLDYEVESIGNGGVEAVELWGTRDGGETWKRWNADPDKQSPFDIEVAKEGLIGFRIVVVAANGLTTPRPTHGEPADIYILVDTAAPRARLTGATYGQGPEAGSLIIDYACSDDNFGDRPISLAFSDSPDGQWTTIATGLSNSGRYVWPADPQLPREIYLRVEATDKAGNVGVHALDVPISVQGLSPQGRIRGFNPIEEEQAQQASLPRASFR